MDLLFVLLGVLVVGIAGAVIGGWLEARMSAAGTSRPLPRLPQGDFGRAEIDKLRFSQGLRGYRMEEVDEALDRLGTRVEQLQQRVAEQEGQIESLRSGPPPDGTRPVMVVDAGPEPSLQRVDGSETGDDDR